MSKVTGGINTKNFSDPAYIAQAASIGAHVDPKSGHWIDDKDGHIIGQKEADQRTQAKGTAVTYDRPRAGTLNQIYDRNQKWIDPALSIGASLIPGIGAIAGPAVSAGLSYGHTHDLGKAALAGAESYGLNKLGSAVGKIPGVSNVGDAIKSSSVGQAISNVGDAIGGSGLGQAWDKNVAQPIQDATQGLHLPSIGKVPAATAGGGGGGLDLLGLAGVANSAYLQDKANNYASNAVQNVDRAYQEKDPIRKMGIAGLQAPPKTLPELGAIRSRGNPFAGGA